MPLQKTVRGLSDLVGLYEAGTLQLDLSRLVAPSLDILQFIEPPRWEFEDMTVQTIDEFDVIGAPVPDNELRLVTFIGYAATQPVPAASNFSMMPRMSTANAAQQFGLQPHQFNTIASQWTATDYPEGGLHFNPYFRLDPGDEIGWHVNRLAGTWATALTVRMGYRYIKIRI